MVSKIDSPITPLEQTEKINEIIDNLGRGGVCLLDHKWSDHLLNDQNCLRADTFSWQDGTVYSEAYNHLVADYNGGTSQTETVGSYTITYVLADDGHKITTDETTVVNIFNESGVSWYYILDTTNQRFKLPKSFHGNIVEKYESGTAWYRVYSDGFCEQGGQTSGGGSVTFLKAFKDTNYSISATYSGTSAGGSVINLNKNTSYVYINGDRAVIWRACGYIVSYPSNDQYKYLYFYVGQFSQSATEQTAGLNSELFNGKADIEALNNKIQPVSTLPVTQTNGVLYVIPE